MRNIETLSIAEEEKMKSTIAVMTFLCAFFLFPILGKTQPLSTQITIYNQGFALVHQKEKFSLKKGLNQLFLKNLPFSLDTASIFLQFESPQEVAILEQNYQSTSSPQCFLQEYLGKEVDVVVKDPVTGKSVVQKGVLLSTGLFCRKNGECFDSKNPILEIGGKIYPQVPGKLIFPPVPADEFFFPRKTFHPLTKSLSWEVESQASGNFPADLFYITQGFSWNADYTALLNSDDTKMDLQGVVSVSNNSGVSFPDVSLQVVAGNINVNQVHTFAMQSMRLPMARVESSSQFTQTPSFEYHLYTLNHPTSLLNGETKQIAFLSAKDVPVKEVLVYDSIPGIVPYENNNAYRESSILPVSPTPVVEAYLQFKNSKKNGLGVPLPAGTFRVYEQNLNGGAILAGESQIGQTAKDEKISLNLGEAFDIVGNRKELSFKELVPHHEYDNTIQIEIRNHKEKKVFVNVIEHLWRGSNWDIVKTSFPYKKVDAHTISFYLEVPPNGATTETYTVRYQW
jgi:hypothetical protein